MIDKCCRLGYNTYPVTAQRYILHGYALSGCQVVAPRISTNITILLFHVFILPLNIWGNVFSRHQIVYATGRIASGASMTE